MLGYQVLVSHSKRVRFAKKSRLNWRSNKLRMASHRLKGVLICPLL